MLVSNRNLKKFGKKNALVSRNKAETSDTNPSHWNIYHANFITRLMYMSKVLSKLSSYKS